MRQRNTVVQLTGSAPMRRPLATELCVRHSPLPHRPSQQPQPLLCPTLSARGPRIEADLGVVLSQVKADTRSLPAC